jgi:hypothetical protein
MLCMSPVELRGRIPGEDAELLCDRLWAIEKVRVSPPCVRITTLLPAHCARAFFILLHHLNRPFCGFERSVCFTKTLHDLSHGICVYIYIYMCVYVCVIVKSVLRCSSDLLYKASSHF